VNYLGYDFVCLHIHLFKCVCICSVFQDSASNLVYIALNDKLLVNKELGSCRRKVLDVI
jgi:hypothetical protein